MQCNHYLLRCFTLLVTFLIAVTEIAGKKQLEEGSVCLGLSFVGNVLHHGKGMVARTAFRSMKLLAYIWAYQEAGIDEEMCLDL